MKLYTKTATRTWIRNALAVLLVPLGVGQVFAMTTYATDGTANPLATDEWNTYTLKSAFAWDEVPKIYLIPDYGNAQVLGVWGEYWRQQWIAPDGTSWQSALVGLDHVGTFLVITNGQINLDWSQIRMPGIWTVKTTDFEYVGPYVVIHGVPDNAVSTFSVAGPVPEPSSYAMLLAGLGIFGWLVRRKELGTADL